ncbi:hypothetical protein [Vibrio splendidus]|uniref:hypothetical protein n=1 Tax=Vibrio splendidus TaxID=29497 RepID=UPI000D3652A4|nr:hypothetical protein [Vibrio splendidus]PTP83185.1 hypothetical protein CWO02_22875 [Vibrio splendidus]
MKNKTHNKSWLSNYAPAEIAPLSSDPTNAQISVLSKHIRKADRVTIIENLTVPPKLINDPLCLALIAYCKSEIFLNLSPGTRKSKFNCFNGLLSFLDEKCGEQHICDVTVIHPDYINYIKNKKRSVSSHVSSINVALKWYINQKNQDLEYIARVKATQARIPKISRDRCKPTQALSELVESIEYDDATLIKSLRKFSVVMLKIMGEQRDYLLSFPEIIEAKSSLPNLSEEVRGLIGRGINNSHKVSFELTQKYLKPIWDAISYSNDGLLIERMLVNCSYTRLCIQNRKEPMTLKEQKELLEQHLNKDGSLKSVTSSYYNAKKNKEAVSVASLSNLSYESLSKPTKVEELLISLLLASERIQPSGQFELSIDDYYITGNTGSWDFSKERSIAKEHSSRIYSLNSLVHHTYLKYIQFYNSGISQEFSVGRSLQATQTRLTYRNGAAYDPYLSVVLKGSYLRNWLLKKHPTTKPFVDLLTKICEENDLLYNSYGKHKRGMKSLALSFVAQSVAINFRRRNVLKRQSAYERYGQNIVNAALDAHTPEVKKNIYINRSETITRINERKWFSETVSEEMVTDAFNIKAALSNSDTKIMSLSEAREILGLKGITPDSDEVSNLGDFLDECAEADYKTGCFSEVTLDSKKIVVEMPITAALMLSYLSALEKEFKKDKYVSSRRKAFMLSRYIYIDETLNKFEPSVIEQGKVLLEQFEIPSPPFFMESL